MKIVSKLLLPQGAEERAKSPPVRQREGRTRAAVQREQRGSQGNQTRPLGTRDETRRDGSDQARKRGHLHRQTPQRQTVTDAANNLTTDTKPRAPGRHRSPEPTREDVESVPSSLTSKKLRTRVAVTEDSGLRASASVTKASSKAGPTGQACTVSGGSSGSDGHEDGCRPRRPARSSCACALCAVACVCVLLRKAGVWVSPETTGWKPASLVVQLTLTSPHNCASAAPGIPAFSLRSTRPFREATGWGGGQMAEALNETFSSSSSTTGVFNKYNHTI